MSQAQGNLQGLKTSQTEALKRLFRRRVPPAQVITPELARAMGEIAVEMGRQVAVLLDRRGEVRFVLVGDDRKVDIPDLAAWRVGHRRLRGLRMIHVHLQGEALTDDDLNDLSGLRLDLIGAFTVDTQGLPRNLYLAHVNPDPQGKNPAIVLNAEDPHHPQLRFDVFLEDLEATLSSAPGGRDVKDPRERAVLVSVTTGRRDEAEDSLEELAGLADSNDLVVVDRILQRPRTIHPRYLLGTGKLAELTLRAMQREADVIIFDQELAPKQLDSVASATELKVIDRTQLILDIFARRAHSVDGKVQVELAQLRYSLPRLGLRQVAMSRLTGGIGGRGPGETRLEVDQRRARDRIRRLEDQLESLSRGRMERRKRRVEGEVPIISVVGYTNVGKSTLLNALTGSDTLAENRLFATLDTATRRLRFPKEREVLITDTVGFIRRLPPELMRAFRATLDELADADLLMHVADISHPQLEQQIAAVQTILMELELNTKPLLLVLNKCDRVDAEERDALCRRFGGLAVSALDRATLLPLLAAMEHCLWGEEGGPWQQPSGGPEHELDPEGNSAVDPASSVGDHPEAV
ncbi:MAG: GTPase HflX [Nitrospirota bacterium]|nr:GTPase HflX [Nitrospirota bacterium]